MIQNISDILAIVSSESIQSFIYWLGLDCLKNVFIFSVFFSFLFLMNDWLNKWMNDWMQVFLVWCWQLLKILFLSFFFFFFFGLLEDALFFCFKLSLKRLEKKKVHFNDYNHDHHHHDHDHYNFNWFCTLITSSS